MAHLERRYVDSIFDSYFRWCDLSEAVEWHREEDIIPAAADVFYLHLLETPNEAVTHFFPEADILDPKSNKPDGVKLDDWIKHLKCIRGLVYELCSTEDKTMVDLWLEYEAVHEVTRSDKTKSSSSTQPVYKTSGLVDEHIPCRWCQLFMKKKGLTNKPPKCSECK